DLSIAPELEGVERTDGAVGDFDFDVEVLDSLFADLSRASAAPAHSGAVSRNTDSTYAMAEDYLAKGMLDRAAAEINRALARGGDTSTGMTLLGDVFARQGLHGEALERYRQARSVNAEVPRAIAGEVRSLLALGRAAG